MKPLNLRMLYGDKYKIARDPAAFLEPNGKRDPWLVVIPCQYGEIFPYDDKLLALMITSGRMVSKVAALGFQMSQEGEGEAVFLFKPKDFEKIARIVKPRRKRCGRSLSSEEAQKMSQKARDAAASRGPQKRAKKSL